MEGTPHEWLVELIVKASKVFVFTGAGISTGSGIPDYRGPSGLWKTRSPVYYGEFMSSEEARRCYWEGKLEGWAKYRDAQPNDAHRAVVELERAGKLLMVVTQNIDGLHRHAGTSHDRLVELHGTMHEVECQSCGRRDRPDSHFERFRETGVPPRCGCGGFLKLATISFGQNLSQEDLRRAFEAASRADLVIALGSTLSVTPAATLPLAAAARGVPYVIINRGSTEHDGLSEVTLRIEGDVVKVFPKAVREVIFHTRM
jgi:NAD-dependent deacetylase